MKVVGSILKFIIISNMRHHDPLAEFLVSIDEDYVLFAVLNVLFAVVIV